MVLFLVKLRFLFPLLRAIRSPRHETGSGKKRQSNREWQGKTARSCIGSHSFLINGSWLLPTKRLFRSAAIFGFHDNRPKMADLKSVYIPTRGRAWLALESTACIERACSEKTAKGKLKMLWLDRLFSRSSALRLSDGQHQWSWKTWRSFAAQTLRLLEELQSRQETRPDACLHFPCVRSLDERGWRSLSWTDRNDTNAHFCLLEKSYFLLSWSWQIFQLCLTLSELHPRLIWSGKRPKYPKNHPKRFLAYLDLEWSFLAIVLKLGTPLPHTGRKPTEFLIKARWTLNPVGFPDDRLFLAVNNFRRHRAKMKTLRRFGLKARRIGRAPIGRQKSSKLFDAETAQRILLHWHPEAENPAAPISGNLDISVRSTERGSEER